MKETQNPLKMILKGSKYKLTSEQTEIYTWLKAQEINTDDDTLNYWSRTYRAQRIMDVVNYAHNRRAKGELIRNIGGWIHKLLITESAIVNDGSKINRELAEQVVRKKNWVSLRIYEKYVRDEVTGDDLPLTISNIDFNRALEALYEKSLLYKKL
jgi:hypothetical protein